MFHSELFSSSNTSSGANTFVQCNAVTTDNIMPSQNNGLTVLNEIPYLCHVIGIGSHIVHVRPQANSMLPFPYITNTPNNRGASAESPVRMLDLSMSPLPLRSSEEFDIFASQNSGGSETQYILASFCDGLPKPMQYQLMPGGLTGNPMVPGRAFTVHGTASTTLSASAWTVVNFTLDQTLPAGTYGLIGLRGFSATGKFVRLFPATGPKWRPGTICTQAYDALDPWFSRAWPTPGGKVIAPMGIWIMFYQNVPPQVEFFATSADTAEEIWFDLVYLSPDAMPIV
jgi:hypothetical protein